MRIVIVGLWLALFGAQGIRAQGWEWVQRYDGPANGDDVASAIVVDTSGNVYVTGWSAGSGTMNDYATIKYNGRGDSVWVNRFNDSDSLNDEASAIAVDGSGNVYVTGRSARTLTGFDYATIKYFSTGGQDWVSRFNAPASGDDAASTLVVDPSGNLYVTGKSAGSGTGDDYATIKYNSSGGVLWVSRYNGPDSLVDEAYALAVDESGNVYVTGRSLSTVTSFDYATVKYGSMGNQQWAARYDNVPTSGADEASAIAVDDLGNVYVTGKSFESGAGNDYFTIKYNSSGVQQWAVRYNGPGNGPDVPSALAVDRSGNVYVTGSSWSGTSLDYSTIKYNSLGAQVWLNLYNGLGNGIDEASAIAVDSSGDVYVTGKSWSGSNNDYATIKYDSTGAELWVSLYNGPANGEDLATTLVVDALGNVYVTGNSIGIGTQIDYVTLKYCSQDDVGTLSLPSPSDTVFTDSTYSPQAWVQNLGGCEVDTIMVIATIGASADTVPVLNLAPGDSFLVTFAPWTVPSGDSATYLFTVCTEMMGDGDPGNDCKEKSIFAHESQGPILLSAVASDNLVPVI
ncbi:SBBP repeat-containing protein, partial [candidate division TA06 bacterium]|nr:SBBP repeat-containing protein [candidate division TA06 bacterium]